MSNSNSFVLVGPDARKTFDDLFVKVNPQDVAIKSKIVYIRPSSVSETNGAGRNAFPGLDLEPQLEQVLADTVKQAEYLMKQAYTPRNHRNNGNVTRGNYGNGGQPNHQRRLPQARHLTASELGRRRFKDAERLAEYMNEGNYIGAAWYARENLGVRIEV